MFKLFNSHRNNIDIDHEAKYYELLNKFNTLSDENSDLKHELNSIKKQVQEAKLDPALTDKCVHCKYCIISNWDGSILGCCKGLVCDNFVRRENED